MVGDLEALAIMKHFDHDQDGQVGYDEFCNTVLAKDYWNDDQPDSVAKRKIDDAIDEEYLKKAQERMADRAETRAIRDACQRLSDVFYKHTCSASRVFGELERMTNDGMVDATQLQTALLRIGFQFTVEDVTRCMNHADC